MTNSIRNIYIKYHFLALSFLLVACGNGNKKSIEEVQADLRAHATAEQNPHLENAIKFLKIASFREKLNYPEKYDKVSSPDEILKNQIAEKTVSEVIALARQYRNTKATQLQKLRELIASKRNGNEVVKSTNVSIEKQSNNFYLNVNFEDSNSNGEKKNYIYQIEMQPINQADLYGIVGFGVDGNSGIVESDSSHFTIRERIPNSLTSYFAHVSEESFPISDFKSNGFNVSAYGSEFTEDYSNPYKPRLEDFSENHKDIEAQKKDLIKLNVLMVELNKLALD
ncbi:MAG: hypothetical protein ACTIJ9_11315 [Aequorivita sp.]